MLLLVGGLSGSTSPDASLGFSVVETDGAERWPTLLLAAQCVLRQNPETGFPSPGRLLDFPFSVINMRPRKIHPFILWNLAVVGNMCQTPIVQLKLTNHVSTNQGPPGMQRNRAENDGTHNLATSYKTRECIWPFYN